MKRALGLAALAVMGVVLSGCAADFGEQARYGITFYCPGAGVDLGDAGVREGLQQAGYRGQVARMTWSLSMNPAVDQTIRIIARQGGERLARYIEQYIDKYPGGEVNLVGLSAGTGVAVWALEALKPGYSVNNVVLIASSLSHDYDVSRAARRAKGRIYNYYSPTDAVLAGPMKVFGTIDGAFLKDGAGAVGLRAPRGGSDRVVNIRWRPEFEKWGYYGGHMDGTNPTFVQHEIARHIIGSAAGEGRRIAFATPWGRALQAGHLD